MMSKLSSLCKIGVHVNFYVAVMVLISFSVLSISDRFSVFNFNGDLYAALDNNLRMMMVYLGLLEAAALAYCWQVKKFQAMTLVGFFLIFTSESIQFYGEVNSVAIDEGLPLFFLYTGLSHLAFGIMGIRKNNRLNPEQDIDKRL